MAEISPKLKPHVPVDILLPEGGTRRVMGLVDTGNLVSPGLCFSEKYAQEVGLKIEKLRPLSIGTAATGSKLGIKRFDQQYEYWVYVSEDPQIVSYVGWRGASVTSPKRKY